MVNRLFLKNIKITKFKIFVAKILYYLVRIFYKDKQVITKNGVTFEIDINEGIELHLFLFGNFQKHVLENKVVKIPADGIILDIGANSGIMSLFFANKIENGFVHAFEPTDYAIKKLSKNLELNPNLKNRIKVNQAFVSSKVEFKSELEAYSSWPIKSKDAKHNIHGGVKKSSKGISSITVDQYCVDNKLNKLTLVKIDTDGHEYEVLKGMKVAISKFRPQIIFEIGIYIMKERKINFSDYFTFFIEFDYQLFTTNGDQVKLENHLNYIPEFGTIDIIAIPTISGEII